MLQAEGARRIDARAYGTGSRTAIPSAIVAAAGVDTSEPLSQDSFMAGALAATTPITRQDGVLASSQAPTPVSSAPFPSGQKSASSSMPRGSSASVISLAIVPAPSAIRRSAPSSTKTQPFRSA